MSSLDEIKKIKVVPVTVFNSIDEVRPLLSSLLKGNIPVAEICFRTNTALDAIKIASKEFPNLLVGAGTVINRTQAKQAIEAGAKFIVSPGFSLEVYEECKKNNIDYLPGVVTPTEIMNCLSLGINHVKFFPAGVFGGLKAINALGSAFPSVQFMPTGGVDINNLKEFLDNKHIFAVGGTWINKGDIVSNCLEANKVIEGE